MLRTFVPDYFRAIRRRPSPRSIKAFLFKLQLARLLIQFRYPDLQDEEARLQELLDAFRAEPLHSGKEDESPYAAIIRQVL